MKDSGFLFLMLPCVVSGTLPPSHFTIVNFRASYCATYLIISPLTHSLVLMGHS